MIRYPRHPRHTNHTRGIGIGTFGAPVQGVQTEAHASGGVGGSLEQEEHSSLGLVRDPAAHVRHGHEHHRGGWGGRSAVGVDHLHSYVHHPLGGVLDRVVHQTQEVLGEVQVVGGEVVGGPLRGVNVDRPVGMLVVTPVPHHLHQVREVDRSQDGCEGGRRGGLEVVSCPLECHHLVLAGRVDALVQGGGVFEQTGTAEVHRGGSRLGTDLIDSLVDSAAQTVEFGFHREQGGLEAARLRR